VQIVFENGIIGLVLWGAFFVNNMKRVIRAIKIHGNIQLYLSFFVQVLFLLYGLFGNPLYDEPQLCSYCIFSAISYGYSEEYQKMEYKAQ
jgi:O-antigen ligase